MLTNKYNLPNSIFRAIENDPYDSGDSDITCTQLISPVQVVALYKKHKDKIDEDISERIWALIGSAIHSILERQATEDVIVEARYFRTVLGWKISGAVDLIEDNIIKDFKTTSVFTWIYGSRFKEWEQQSNINNWLRSAKWGGADGLKDILILRDWVKSKAGTGKYPPSQIVEVDLPMWDLKKAEDFVIERVKLHQEAQKCSDEELARKFPCSVEDRWLSEKTGEFARCKLNGGYCPVRHICYQNLKSIKRGD